MKTGINRRISKKMDLELITIINDYKKKGITLSYAKASEILIEKYKQTKFFVDINA